MEPFSSIKANNLLFCSIVLQALAPLDPLIRYAPCLSNLSRFDEPTSPGVTMTESHTRCASRGHKEHISALFRYLL